MNETMGAAVPVMRIFDEAKARAFYLEYLGFEVVFEHRFEPGLPLYMRVRRGQAILDLSEHHGDGTPGTGVWIPLLDVRSFHAEITAREYPNLRPGIDEDAPGGPTTAVIDPFGNVIRFCEVEKLPI